MLNPKIFLYINLLLKTLVLLYFLTTGLIIMMIIAIFIDFFITYGFFFIGFGIPMGILLIILLSSFILSYFIFFCERKSEYQKFKKYYAINFVAELMFLLFYFNQIMMDLMEGYFERTTIWISLFIMTLIAAIMGIVYFFLKRRSLISKHSSENLEKLKDILNISDRIKLERVQNVLNLDDKVFDVKIIEWAKEFGFRIDGEYLIVNKESISDFVEALDEKFVEWEKKEKDKDGKF